MKRKPPPPSFLEWLDKITKASGSDWTWDWHYQLYIQEHLQQITDGKLKRLMLFIPPRHGKSELTTVRYPIYRLTYNRNYRIIIGAYSAALSKQFSKSMRKIAKDLCGIQISRDANAVDKWQTVVENGGMSGGVRAVGVGGGVTGMGADLIVIDDPVKSRAEANSKTYRDACYEWYRDDLRTRLEPGGAIILIMTRWHEDDLAGRILASEEGKDWTVIRLPAFAEENDALQRKPGDALCPERFDIAALLDLRKILKSSFEALFQQRPVADGGNIFKSIWFQNRYKTLPKMKAVYTCWDTALKDAEENDESACVTAGEGEDGDLYILRVCHGRYKTPALAKFLAEQARYYRELWGDKYVGDFVEDKVSGTTLMQFMKISDPDLVLIPIKVGTESKTERAHGVTPICESERIRFPDEVKFAAHCGSVADLIKQLTTFPAGHDDIVDAFVYVIKRYLRTLKTGTATNKSRRGKTRAADTT